MLSDIRSALALVGPNARWRWVALLPLAVVAAAAEAIGAAAVFLLLRLLTDPDQAAALPGAAWLYDRLPDQSDRGVVLAFTGVVALFYVARSALLILSGYAHDRVSWQTVLQITDRVLKGYLEAPYGFLLTRNTASLIQRVQRGAEVTATQALGSLINLITECLVLLALTILLAVTAPRVTFAAVVLTAMLLLLPAALTVTVFRRWGAAEQRLEKQALQHLQQSLGGIKELKVTGTGPFFRARYNAVRRTMARVQRRRSTLSTALRLSVETVFVIVLVLIIVMVSLGGMPAPEIVSLLGLFAYAGFRMVPSINRITLNLNLFRGAAQYTRDILADLADLSHTAAATPSSHPREELTLQRSLELRDVSYTYRDGLRPALEGISLAIERGESIGIVGPTGSGKTTLVDLLLGLLQPTAGSIRVDGRDIRSNIRGWQAHIGYVPQFYYLLDDTLRANIAFGVPSETVDERRLARAVEMAHLSDVVAGIDGGLDAVVGERGARLSGGQRQRVAIARALYHEPSVLVFDEATAALDSLTEQEITGAVRALQGQCTVLVIAHRLSTVRQCDRIVLLHDGRVAAVGPFDRLMAEAPSFRALAGAG
jgi:ATP-binding cassette, subfamily B, bacterial PglK